jgi:hypothetical protein
MITLRWASLCCLDCCLTSQHKLHVPLLVTAKAIDARLRTCRPCTHSFDAVAHVLHCCKYVARTEVIEQLRKVMYGRTLAA